MTKKPEDENFDVFLTHLKDQQVAAAEQAADHVDKVDKIISAIRSEDNRKFVVENFPETYLGQKFKWIGSYEEFSKVTLHGCPHVSLETPSMYYINLWGPQAIGCAECINAKAVGFNKAYPNICDFCYQKYEIFHESMFQIGPFIIVGNVCDYCYNKQYEAVR